MAKWDQEHREDGGRVLQVHAWDVTAERLVRIETGEADRLRPLCNSEQLICPYPGCPDPRFNTVSEYTNRHGTPVPAVFRHKTTANTGHDPESWFHLTGKLLIAEWLRRDPAGWTVFVERTVEIGPKRRPDVSATRPDGPSIALEVQYSPIDPDLWRARSSDLISAGFRPIWIWGHRGAYARPVSDGVLRLNALVQLAWHEGQRPHWIDPELENIVSIAPGSARHDWMAECEVVAEPLGAATVVDGRIVTPADVAAEAEERRVAAEREAERKKEELREARAAEAAEAERVRLEQRENETDAERARREEFRDRRRAEDAAAWERSPLRRRIVDRYGDIPEIISVGTPKERGILRHPEEWRAAVFMDRVQGHVGETMPYAKWTRTLLGRQKNTILLFEALNGYLFMLRKAGNVTFDNWGLRIGGDITVLADLDHPPAPPEVPPWHHSAVARPAPDFETRRPTAGLPPPKYQERIRALVATLSEPTTTSKLMAEAGVRPSPGNRQQVINLLLELKWAKTLRVERSNDIFDDGSIYPADAVTKNGPSL